MFCCLLSLDHSVYVRRDDPAMQSLARFHIAYGFVESAAPLVQEDVVEEMQKHPNLAHRVERGSATALCHSTTLSHGLCFCREVLSKVMG